MELLVLGGTSFAGRHVVEQALAAGHTVTTFNRGRTNPGLFPDVRTLQGDRESGDYAALDGAGPFDAVVDMCAYVPRAVREAIAALGPTSLDGPYILISSVSAYAEPQAQVDGQGFTEESPLAAMPEGVDPSTEDVTGETYGPLKVLTEEEAKKHHPGGVMIIRPGLIVGPHDPTDRFTYWVRRMAEGGEVLAPEEPAVARTQVIDACDLARWIVASAAAGRVGTFNAVAGSVLLADVLDAAADSGKTPCSPDTAGVGGAHAKEEAGGGRPGGRRRPAGRRRKPRSKHSRVGSVGVSREAQRAALERSARLGAGADGRVAPRRRIESRRRRARNTPDRGGGGRPCRLGP